eukprot:4870863-Pyramimonas_sp.AAC.1
MGVRDFTDGICLVGVWSREGFDTERPRVGKNLGVGKDSTKKIARVGKGLGFGGILRRRKHELERMYELREESKTLEGFGNWDGFY